MAVTPEHMWDSVYDFASRTWVRARVPLRGYDDRDARSTADTAVAGYFTGGPVRGYRRRPIRALSRMPRPGTMLNLTPRGGYVEGLDAVRRDVTILRIKWSRADDVPALWSKRLQAVLILPTMRQGLCNLPVPVAENELAKVWQKGRPATCAAPATYPSPPMPYVLPILQTSYVSDKFTPKTLTRYIHHHEPGGTRGPVLVYFSSDPRRGQPVAIMIRGGKLRLTSHGIDG